MKVFQHGNMILDMRNQRMKKDGIDIREINMSETTSYFTLKYKIDKNNKIELNEHGEKTLELRGLINDNNPEYAKKSITDALTVARQYSTQNGLDLVYQSRPTTFFNQHVDSHINNDIILNGKRTPMTLTELHHIADKGLPVEIKTRENMSAVSYKLPENLKTHISLEDHKLNGVDHIERDGHCTIETYTKNNELSLDFSNISINNNANMLYYIFLGKGVSSHNIEDYLGGHFNSPTITSDDKNTTLDFQSKIPNEEDLYNFYKKNPQTTFCLRNHGFFHGYLYNAAITHIIDENVKDTIKRLNIILEENEKIIPSYLENTHNKKLFEQVKETENSLKNQISLDM